MSKYFLPYALPEIGDEEIEAVVDALRSGWVTSGPKAKAFEEQFRDYLDESIHALAVNSATAGLHLALEALGIGPGDEVLAPTLTFTATVEVVRYLGADPVLVDVDPITLNMDTAGLREYITPRTKAIIPVHYGGLACDMDPILNIAREYGLKVIEDAAHALPSTYGGRLIGTLESDAAVFSFYANKTITTGEGGLVVTRSQEVADRIKVMRLHGIDRDAFNRFRSEKPSWFYEVIAPGYKYNLTDIAAALGAVQLKRLPHFHERRKELANQYFDQLAGLPLILPASPPAGDEHAWHLYVIRLSEEALAKGIERDVVIEQLSAKGIGTSVHYIPLHRQPYWRDRYELHPQMFPAADRAFRTMLSLPLYTRMTDDDQRQVVTALREVLA